MSSTTDQSKLLANCPADGSTIGNKSLREKLDWGEDKYWTVRDSLLDLGEIKKGRGRGGAVRRLQIEGPEPLAGNTSPSGRLPEEALYEPMKEQLEGGWAKDKRFSLSVVEVTARQGGRATGGRWTRPDIVAVAMSTFRYLPDSQFDLITFEVKPADSIDVTAVYEAVAHLRAATMAYVLVTTDETLDLDEIGQESERHGIGLLAAENPADYSTWTEMVEPARHEPDAHRLDEFIATQLTDATRNKIIKDFR